MILDNMVDNLKAILSHSQLDENRHCSSNYYDRVKEHFTNIICISIIINVKFSFLSCSFLQVYVF